MKNWIILLLAAATVILSIRLASAPGVKTENEKTQMNENEMNVAYENILSRRSVRSYTARAVEDTVIEKLLRAGMAAPSARDARPWDFIVVTEQDLKEKIATASPNAAMAAKAPLAIVVCGNMDKTLDGVSAQYWIQDCSAATENILLAAHALGLGAVWCGFYPSQERQDALRGIFEIPANLVPLNVISIGYPEGLPTPKDKWDPSIIHYNKF